MKKDRFRGIIFDFDSTLVAAEGIEMLVEAGLEELAPAQREEKIQRLKQITQEAMSGQIPFARALQERLQLARVIRRQVQQVAEKVLQRINPKVQETILALQKDKREVFVFSGGFAELVLPVTRKLGIPDERAYVNRLIYDESDAVIGVDPDNPLTMSSGKVFLAEKLRTRGIIPGRTLVVGDGFSDLAIRKLRVADFFVYFSGCVNREDIRKESDAVIEQFDQLLPLLRKLESK